MIHKVSRQSRRNLIHGRIRKKVFGTMENPRLCVFRSAKHIYAQLVDDSRSVTLVQASTLDKEFLNRGFQGKKRDAAKIVGEILAKRARENGVKTVRFDRGGFRYHGRVKALADGAREQGLEF